MQDANASYWKITKLLLQETRLYNPDTNSTLAMREKELENDYRYFPDPDLLPIQVTRYQIAEIKNNLPALPEQIAKDLKSNPLLNDEDVQFILSSPAAYRYYKEIKAPAQSQEKLIINWLKGPYAAALNEAKLDFDHAPVSPKALGSLLEKVHNKTLSSSLARMIFAKLWMKEEDIEAIMVREGLGAQNALDLNPLINQLIAEHPQQAADYRAGKEKLLAFFVGQLMKQTKGQADPEEVNRLLKSYLLK